MTRSLQPFPACVRRLAVLAFSLLLSAFPVYALDAEAADGPVIETADGPVRGFALAPDVVAFRGIPFAAPPVGALRWKPPQAPEPWTEVLEANRFSPDCMQYRYRPQPTPTSEDCLYINVSMPAGAKPGDRLPVHVWIYGGAFRTGGASSPGSENLGDPADGIVFVSFNYRVNVFGFMAHPGLTAESPHGASGNYGLMDSIAALEWVQDNIDRFGGDPGQVTVSGVSAGAASIGYLLISPLAKGLFHRVLMESAAGWHPQRTRKQQEDWSVGRFGADLAELRAMPAEDLLALTASDEPGSRGDGTDTLGDGRSGPFSYIDWLPIVDGYVVPRSDRDAWKAGAFHVVDMLIGDNENEGYMFMQFGPPIPMERAAYEAYMRAEYRNHAEEALQVYPVTTDADVAYQLGLATGDLLFQLPAREMARRMAQRNPRVYRYHFTKHTSASPVAMHGQDVPYWFGNLAPGGPFDDSDRPLSAQMQAAKRRFIHSGDPNGGELPVWPPYDSTDPYMTFGDQGPVPGAGLRNRALDFAVKVLDERYPLE